MAHGATGHGPRAPFSHLTLTRLRNRLATTCPASTVVPGTIQGPEPIDDAASYVMANGHRRGRGERDKVGMRLRLVGGLGWHPLTRGQAAASPADGQCPSAPPACPGGCWPPSVAGLTGAFKRTRDRDSTRVVSGSASDNGRLSGTSAGETVGTRTSAVTESEHPAERKQPDIRCITLTMRRAHVADAGRRQCSVHPVLRGQPAASRRCRTRADQAGLRSSPGRTVIT